MLMRKRKLYREKNERTTSAAVTTQNAPDPVSYLEAAQCAQKEQPANQKRIWKT